MLMNHTFENSMSREALMQKASLEMLVVIVNRPDADRAANLLRKMRFHFLLSLRAEGTTGVGLADLIGLGSIDKTVLISLAPNIWMPVTLEELKEKFHLEKPGRGVAFTIPLSGICPPAKLKLPEEKKERIRTHMEGRLEKMLENITHSLILTIINQGHSEALMECAQGAGAAGGTVLSAHHLGAEEAVKFLGIPLQAEKEIVAILATREEKAGIMEQIEVFLREHPKAQGALLTLPVDNVVGMNCV